MKTMVEAAVAILNTTSNGWLQEKLLNKLLLIAATYTMNGIREPHYVELQSHHVVYQKSPMNPPVPLQWQTDWLSAA